MSKEYEEYKKMMDEKNEKLISHYKKLVEDGQLKFDCHHQSNLKYLFENDKKRFIKDLEIGINLGYENEEKGKIELGNHEYCFACGEYLRFSLKNNVLSSNKKEECFEIKPFFVDISIPSGHLLMVDWPEHGKEILKYLDEGKISINAYKGQVLRSLDYAKENIMHFFVGNTCPSVYVKDEVIYIGTDGYTEEDEEIPLVEGGERVGYICTDLWWVTAFDYTTYEQLVKKEFGEEKSKEIMKEVVENVTTNIQVKPGVYRCHYYNASEDDSPRLFSKMEWLKEIE